MVQEGGPVDCPVVVLCEEQRKSEEQAPADGMDDWLQRAVVVSSVHGGRLAVAKIQSYFIKSGNEGQYVMERRMLTS